MEFSNTFTWDVITRTSSSRKESVPPEQGLPSAPGKPQRATAGPTAGSTGSHSTQLAAQHMALFTRVRGIPATPLQYQKFPSHARKTAAERARSGPSRRPDP